MVVGGWLLGVGCWGEVGGEVEWISDGRISVVFEWITPKKMIKDGFPKISMTKQV